MDHSLISLPPLEGLIAVLAAAASGSFTQAAETLGLTHGAISRRVASVEAWLGTALFERHARGVRVTPAGRRFVSEIEAALFRIGRTADQWRPRRVLETLRISVLPSFAKLWLIPRIGMLQGEPPDLRLEVLVEHRLSSLDARESDLVVRYGLGGWPSIRAHLLFDEHLSPVAIPSIARRVGRNASTSVIANEPLLHDSNTGQWRAWLAGGGVRYKPRQVDRRFEDYDLVLAAAEAGLGVALLRRPFAEDWLRSGRLVPLSMRELKNPASHFVGIRRNETRPSVLSLVERFALCAHPLR